VRVSEAGTNDRRATGRSLGRQPLLGILAVEPNPNCAGGSRIAKFVPNGQSRLRRSHQRTLPQVARCVSQGGGSSWLLDGSSRRSPAAGVST
jgi:hypothetical protein